MTRGKQIAGAIAIVALMLSSFVQTTPVTMAQAHGITIVASGLTTPGGFTWNANDILFVALAGSGGSDPVLPETPAPLGPLLSGETGVVARIKDGCPVTLITGIVSTRTAQGRVFGAEAIAELDNQLYVLISNAGDQFGDHALDPGVYRAGGDGSLQLIADHAAFLQAHPPAQSPPEGFPNPGNPVALVSGNGALWIADELNGLISKVVPGQDETLVADLSGQAFAPSDLALSSDGSLYVSSIGQTPFETGSSSVVHITAGGEMQTVWTGLTMASGIAIGNDGVLYATELASDVSEASPGGLPGSGRLVRQSSAGTFDIVADGLSFPAALGTGPNGALYFVTGTIGSANGTSTIARFAPDGSTAAEAPPDCTPIPETLSAGSDTSIAVQPTSEPTQAPDINIIPTATPTPTPVIPWTPDSAAPTGEVVEVGLSEYAIDMPSKLPAGPITFLITNYGSLTHSFAIEGAGIDEVLTHELEPEQQGAFTVELRPGSYTVSSPSLGDPENGMSLVLTVG